MVEGSDYIKTVKEYFEFLQSELNFVLSEEKLRGNLFYDVQYKNKTKVISVSYENIEDYLLVTVFLLEKNELPDYDDKTKTLHLNKLNSSLISLITEDEMNQNIAFFSNYPAKTIVEKKILKYAKELRLCMRHIDKIFS